MHLYLESGIESIIYLESGLPVALYRLHKLVRLPNNMYLAIILVKNIRVVYNNN